MGGLLGPVNIPDTGRTGAKVVDLREPSPSPELRPLSLPTIGLQSERPNGGLIIIVCRSCLGKLELPMVGRLAALEQRKIQKSPWFLYSSSKWNTCLLSFIFQPLRLIAYFSAL